MGSCSGKEKKSIIDLKKSIALQNLYIISDQNTNQPLCLNWIMKLYSLQKQDKEIPQEFRVGIGQIQSKADLLEYFEIQDCDLNGYRRVRDNGNSFYTSLCFQYIKFKKQGEIYDQQKEINIKYKNQLDIPFIEQIQLSKVFQYQHQKLTVPQFEKVFSNFDDPYYALCICYFRNIVFKLSQKEQTLEWQQEFNIKDGEILKKLAIILKTNIIVYHFLQGSVQKQNYGKPQKDQIHILYQNGSYQIGIKDAINNDPQLAIRYIKQLYDLSLNKRQVPPEYKSMVGEKLDQNELINYYSANTDEIAVKLQEKLVGYRRIRGDGNCFYTAFVFQYLQIVLNRYTNKEFDKLIQTVQKMKFQIKYDNEFSIPQEIQILLAQQFCNRLKDLRGTNAQLLDQQIADTEDTFYGLAIIFLRNLCNDLQQNNSMAQQITEENIRYFTFHNQVIIYYIGKRNVIIMTQLSLFLQNNQRCTELKYKSGVNVYVVDAVDKLFFTQEYQPTCKQKISLILTPGHYQIGIEK